MSYTTKGFNELIIIIIIIIIIRCDQAGRETTNHPKGVPRSGERERQGAQRPYIIKTSVPSLEDDYEYMSKTAVISLVIIIIFS